jgi:hypothetical protein
VDIPGHDELEALIFPQLEQSYELVKEAGYKTEIAGYSYLDLLKHGRKVLIEDIASLQDDEDFKDHPIVLHPV